MAYTLGWVAGDWSIDSTTGDIRYIGGDHGTGTASYVTVIDFHRALQDFADNATASGNDLLDISSLTPSDRSTDNIVTLLSHDSTLATGKVRFNITATEAEHIYDGTIIQSSGDEFFDGVVNFGNAKYIIVHQNGSVANTGLGDFWNSYSANAGENYTFPPSNTQAGISHNFMIKTRKRESSTATTGTTTTTLIDSTATFKTWGVKVDDYVRTAGGFAKVSAVTNETTLTLSTAIADLADTTAYTIAHDIDKRLLLGLTREFEFTYAEFSILGTARGNNVLALSESDDLNNNNDSATVGTWDKFANDVEGYDNTQDINIDSTNEKYYSRWDIDAGTAPTDPTINHLYEYTKYLQRRGTVSTLYGLNGDLFRGITHQVTYTGLAGGNFADSQSVSFTSGACSAQVLADDGTGTMWVQLLTGAEADITGTITQGGVTATVSVVTARPISPTFLGQSTGSAIIGAYGVGIDATDVSSTDSLKDLTNATITPPNNVTFSVKGLENGDRVLVAPYSGDDSAPINTLQMTSANTYNTAGVTSFQVNAIPSDIPSTGTIRVVNDAGFHVLLTYTAYDLGTDTFTINSYDFSGSNENASVTTGNGAYMTYIDKQTSATEESFTVVYASGINLFVRVRDAGATPMKTFQTNASFGDANSSVTTIRTSDS